MGFAPNIPSYQRTLQLKRCACVLEFHTMLTYTDDGTKKKGKNRSISFVWKPTNNFHVFEVYHNTTLLQIAPNIN